MDFDFGLDTITPDVIGSLTIGGTGSLVVPTGTTAQRPASAVNGMLRYNSDILKLEKYENNFWATMATAQQNAVLVASTGNVTIASPGATIDGITLVAGNRVLLWQQTTNTQNGIYVWNGAAVAMTRAADQTNDWNDTVPGRLLYVQSGTQYANFEFQCMAASGGTFGTTAMAWTSDLYAIGKILVGDSATPARAASSVITSQRVYTLIDTVAFQRLWRYVAAGSNLNCGMDMVIGNNDLMDNAANLWWDISLRGELEGIGIVKRTGGIYEPKLFINAAGGVTVGASVLASVSTGTDFAASSGTDLYINGTAALKISTGTTAQRPVTGAVGEIRYNSSTGRYEAYNGTTWISLQSVVLQVVTGTISTTTGTTTVPYDATVPQSTEGFQIWTQSFTPISAASKILINFSITCDNGTAGRTLIMSAFRGTTNIGSAIRAADAGGGIGGATVGPGDLGISVVDSPATTSAITYSARIGGDAAGTTYINRSAAQTLGNACVSSYTIMEVL